MNKRVGDNVNDIKIDEKGVEKLLEKIQPHKASGPDEIPNIVLKMCSKSLAPGISALFQKSLDTGELPKDWIDANITSVFKKSDKHTAETIDQYHLLLFYLKCWSI